VWNGFKLHISETCRAGDRRARQPRPNLITNVATTSSTVPDGKALDGIHRSLQRRALLPEEHYFTIDWQAEQAVCPPGKTSTTWIPVVQEGMARTVVSFAAAHCIPCPPRDQCATSAARRILLPQPSLRLSSRIRSASMPSGPPTSTRPDPRWTRWPHRPSSPACPVGRGGPGNGEVDIVQP
jgi:hypothetical protein